MENHGTGGSDSLHSIVASAPDAIVVADADGRVVSWNPAAEQMFGHAGGDVVGGPLWRIVPERFREAHNEGLARVVATGETRIVGSTVEVAGLHADGHEFPIELSLSTWLDGGDRYFGGIIRDVSERVALVEALTRSEQRMQAILESANDAVIAIDDAGLVTLWNPTATNLFGYTADEMLGEPLDAIIPARHRAGHVEGVERVVAGGEQRVIGAPPTELQGLHRDGREFPIELSLATWSSQGRRHFTGIVRDITERKHAEKALELANKTLNEKNAQLEALSVKLAKYLSRQVYDSIFSGRTEVQVTSYRRELTVFFSDIEGFTDLTDRLEAEALSQLLNRYLGEMSRIADDCGGTIDKFIGDGIMIFFGDPESHGRKDDALACVRMALRMRQRAAELSREWFDTVGPTPLHFRMGINTGWCTVGNFGSEDRLDYTIVGSAVNIASRLEETAGPNQIQVSHTTYALIRDQIYCRPLGDVRVKGVSHELRTYEVVGDMADMGARERIQAEMGGFNLSLDPLSLDPAEAARARRALQEALEALGADATEEPTAGPAGSDDPDGGAAREAGPVS